MAIVNFYLKNANDTSETLIFLFFSFEGKRLKYSTGEKIKPTMWLKDKQRVKPQAAGSLEINQWLNTLEAKAIQIYREARNNGETITENHLRDKLNSTRPGTSKITLFDRFEEFITASASDKSENTIKAYKTALRHVREFVEYYRYPFSFDAATQEFYDRFTVYLRDTHHCTDNTVGKQVSILKTFLSYGVKRKWHKNKAFQEWKVEKIASNKPALTREEFAVLRRLDLSANKRLEKVRDVFVFACFTGFRYSDIKQLRPEHIQNDNIILNSVKTHTIQRIPLAEPTKTILQKYGNTLPDISNQKLNDYLKELGKEAGLTRPYEIVQFKNGKRVAQTSELFELLTMHVARRTFATLAQDAGMPIKDVMGVTGHTKSETLQKSYTRTTDKALQASYNQFIDFVETT
jgi:site-specific recombinase XerD